MQSTGGNWTRVGGGAVAFLSISCRTSDSAAVSFSGGNWNQGGPTSISITDPTLDTTAVTISPGLWVMNVRDFHIPHKCHRPGNRRLFAFGDTLTNQCSLHQHHLEFWYNSLLFITLQFLFVDLSNPSGPVNGMQIGLAGVWDQSGSFALNSTTSGILFLFDNHFST